MTRWILRQLERLPQPWRFIVTCLLVVMIVGAGVVGFNQIRACGYDKAKQQYEVEEAKRKTERERLIGENAQLRKQIAELEPQALAYKAIVDAKAKADQALKDQIEKVSEEAANAEANANQPVDCRVRAERVCALLRSNRIPHDCAAITRETCGQ